MKKLLVIVIAAILAVSISACSSSNGAEVMMPAVTTAAAPSGDGFSGEYVSADYANEVASAGSSYPTVDGDIPPDIAADIRKIIREASLDVESEDVKALYGSVSAYCEELGGYVFSNETQNYETYSVISATIKIPPEHLDAFLTYIGNNGKVINSRTDSQDVTEDYYDTQTRLETKRKSLEQYYEFLENAKDTDEVLRVQRIIDGIVEEIEAAEGHLKLLNSLVDMSTVYLHLRQENDPVKIEADIDWSALSFDDMGRLIKNGLTGVLSFTVTAFQWIIIVISVISPFLIPFAVLVVILIIRARKNKKKFTADSVNPSAIADKDGEK